MMRSILNRRVAAVLLAFAAVCYSGCGKAGKPAFKATDVSMVNLAKDFKLTDHNGKTRTLADFKGKVVLLFFGYTHCPDVCATTLLDLAAAMKKLGKDAERVQVLFVTVDPARDTPKVLAQFVPSFHPGFLGLYGDETALAKTAEEFRVFYQKHGEPGSDKYTMDHNAGTFIYDPRGKLRLYANYGQGADAFAADIRLLLNGA